MARDIGRNSTRLSALFVAAILIPGCFLAYFSIQNVGSQKELAEKRLQQEEQGLAAELGAFLRDDLVKTATVFFTAADRGRPISRNLRSRSKRDPMSAARFASTPPAVFLWPRYVAAGAAGEPASESTRFIALFSDAETAEFRRKESG